MPSKMVRVGCGFFLLLAFASSTAVDHSRRDGNWWLTLADYDKATYMVGFFDGMGFGSNVSAWSLITYDKDTQATTTALAGYREYVNNFFSNVTSKQIADGLDAFYKDHRNRSIPIGNGVVVVVRQIAGIPDAEIEQLTEAYRRAAIQN